MIQHINIYRVGETYVTNIIRSDGVQFTVEEWPDSEQELLDRILAFVGGFKSPQEQETERIFQATETLLPDDKIIEFSSHVVKWNEGEAVVEGNARTYEGDVYRCIQPHTTQADWTPDVTPALWVKLTPDEAEGKEIIRWFEPTAEHNYSLGQLVVYTDDKIYESKLNDNIWSPTAYPTGWEFVRDATEEEINGD